MSQAGMDDQTAARINAAAAVLMSLPPMTEAAQAAWDAGYIKATKEIDR